MFKPILSAGCLALVLCLTPGFAQAVAGYDCTAPYPCDKPTVAECEADLEANVCPRPDCTCIPLYYRMEGSSVTLSYVCDKFKKPAQLTPINASVLDL